MVRELIEYPTWVKRMETYFKYIDQNNSGIITINEIQRWATNMEATCNARPTEMVALRAELFRFWGQIGLVRDVRMTQSAFIENLSRFGHEEAGRVERGDETFLKRASRAYFDVFDIDKDGVVSLEELRTVMSATNDNNDKLDEAKTWLDAIGGKRGDGSVDRYELYHSEYNFWFNPLGKCVLCVRRQSCDG